MQTLIISLSETITPGVESDATLIRAKWLITDSGGLPQSEGEDALSVVTEHAAHCRVIVIVPSEQVLITHVKTQARKAQQLAKAVPYALEEDLAEDIEQLHFALGPRLIGDEYAITVVAHAQMQAWMELLKSASISPRMMIPDIFAIPYIEGAWSLLLESHRAVLRTEPYQGTAIEPDNVLAILNAISNQVAEHPESLAVYRCDKDATTVRLSELPYPCSETRDCPPALFAAGLNEKYSINLLQGRYGIQDDTLKKLKPWRLAAALLAIWLVISIGTGVIENLRLEREDQAIQARIGQIYRGTFPTGQDNLHSDTQRIQMEQRLNELQGAPSGTTQEADFMSLMNTTGQAIKSSPNVTIQTVTFRDSSLEMNLQSDNWQSLENIQKSIAKQGLSATIGAADTRGTTVSAQLLIKGNSS